MTLVHHCGRSALFGSEKPSTSSICLKVSENSPLGLVRRKSRKGSYLLASLAVLRTSGFGADMHCSTALDLCACVPQDVGIDICQTGEPIQIVRRDLRPA